MISARWGIRLTLIFGAIAISGFCVYRTGIFLFGMTDYVFVIDSAFAPDIQKTIVHRIQQAPRLTAHGLQTELQSLGLALDQLIITRYATKTAVIEVTSAAACAQLNTDKILTASGAVVERMVFNPLFVEKLPHIEVADLASLTAHDTKWLLTWLPELAQRYTIHWVHDHEIYLKEKKDAVWQVVCSCDCVFDTVLCERIAQAKEKVMEKVGNKYHKGNEFVADVRFEKQIIIGGRRGGITHG